MTDYTELIKKLRDLHRDPRPASAEWLFENQVALYDAAAAIEALNRLLDQNTQRCEALRKQLREAHESYEKHLSELEAQLPKRGEWLNVTDSYHWYGKCSVCGEEFVVDAYYAGGMNYCPNCGALMVVQE